MSSSRHLCGKPLCKASTLELKVKQLPMEETSARPLIPYRFVSPTADHHRCLSKPPHATPLTVCLTPTVCLSPPYNLNRPIRNTQPCCNVKLWFASQCDQAVLGPSTSLSCVRWTSLSLTLPPITRPGPRRSARRSARRSKIQFINAFNDSPMISMRAKT